MAESNEGGGASETSSSTWWGGWLQTVQEKSSSALEQMRKDLGEFGTTIQRDTSQAAASTANVIREKLKVAEEEEEDENVTTTTRMKVGFSKLLTGLSQSLAPRETTHGDDDVPITHKDPHIFDREKARLHAMQTDPTTYCSDPDGHLEIFHDWLEKFNVDAYKGDISELLVANTEVRALYTKLVPAAVSHVEFWGRYFYRVKQLKQDEARRNALKERAAMTESQKFEEEDLGWGDEDESWDTMPDAVKGQSGVERFVVLPQGEGQQEDMAEDRQKCRTKQEDEEKEERGTESTTGGSEVKLTTLDSKQDSDNETPPTNHQISTSSEEALTHCSHERNSDESNHVRDEQGNINIESVIPEESASNVDSSSSPAVENLSLPKPEKPRPEISEPVPADTPSSQPEVIEDPAPASSSSPVQSVTVEAEKRASETTSDESGKGQSSKDATLTLEGLTVKTNDQEDASASKPTEQVSPVASEKSNRESSLSDDWEKDFDDIEVTEEDLKNVSSKLAADNDDLDDDWENWD